MRQYLYYGAGLLLVALVSAGGWFAWQAQPPVRTAAATVTITPGSSVPAIAHQLAQANVVRSPALFRALFALRYDSTRLQAGTYEFAPGETIDQVATRILQGDVVHEQVILTFPEGITAAVMGDIAAATLPNFDQATWNTHTASSEGELFPDTYHVDPDYTATDLAQLLHNQHETVLANLLATASTSLTRDDIVILASILEREANSPESMQVVAGVFLNRLAIGMPLQADASIEYVLDTPLGELPPGQLAAQLRQLDSPYNTYLYQGLPPTAIGNPGSTALAAVINPQPSDYLYYLTAPDGTFHYATTYAQHLSNIERHLR